MARCLTLATLGSCLLLVADQTAPKPISRDGLMKAVELGGLSSDELVTYINDLGVDFKLTEQDRQHLVKSGVEERVLNAIASGFRAPKPQVDERAARIAQLSTGPPMTKEQLVGMLRQGVAPDIVEKVVDKRGIAFAMSLAEGREIESVGGNRGLLGALFMKTPTPPAPIASISPRQSLAASPQATPSGSMQPLVPAPKQGTTPPSSTPPSQTPPPSVPKPNTPINQAAAALTAKTVQPAKPLRQLKVDYPPAARRDRISGTVRLELVISETGTIERARVLRGHPILAAAAEQAAKHWLYHPALIDGKPTKVTTEVDFVFKMDR